MREKRTIQSCPLHIHSGSQNALGTNCSLSLETVLGRRSLHNVGLEYKACMTILGHRREASCDLPLGSEKL